MPRVRQHKDYYFCEKAIDAAMKSSMQHRHGCVIVYNDKEVVAYGYNHTRNTSMENIFSIHAEMEAINKLRQIAKTKNKDFINKCKLYVVRIGTSNMNYPLKLSQPCMHCAKAIRDIGIPRVIYSVSDDEIEEQYIPSDKKYRDMYSLHQKFERYVHVR